MRSDVPGGGRLTGNCDVAIVGGGAAGFFAAIHCAEARAGGSVVILERTARFLSKVRISGGGRCNVTHASADLRDFASRYPRGEKAVLAAFHRFQPGDTVEWFRQRGVELKTEADGRMFPVTNDSATIVDCLLESAVKAGVKLAPNCGLAGVTRAEGGGFLLVLSNGQSLECGKLLLATGGCRTASAAEPAVSLGHTLAAPVPSLFTFHVENPWVRSLAGVTVEKVTASVPGTRLREEGPLLLTHWGVSGPAVLRLSAWGARVLHGMNYRFPLHLHWLPHLDADGMAAEFDARRASQPARRVVNTPISPLPARLWEQLVIASGLAPEARWAELSGGARHALARQLMRTELTVTGKSLNKDEFVTCGGVKLSEVDFRTMESRVCPGLYFAGELLDIDGITGGFNFQAAWTTGFIAGRAMAGA